LLSLSQNLRFSECQRGQKTTNPLLFIQQGSDFRSYSPQLSTLSRACEMPQTRLKTRQKHLQLCHAIVLWLCFVRANELAIRIWLDPHRAIVWLNP
jgi:hypothetical protein